MNKLGFLQPKTLHRKIRLGPQCDGGYIVYEPILHEVDALMTYGVGWDIRFEQHFSELTGKEVRMFDPTMFGRYLLNTKGLKQELLKCRFGATVGRLLNAWYIWKLKKKLESSNVHFVNEGLSTVKIGKFSTFQDQIERFKLKGKRIIFKMDIEGGEYDIFLERQIFAHMTCVDQLIVEFHDLKARLRDLRRITADLANAFTLVHIHANNYGGVFCLYDLESDGINDAEIPDTVELLWVRTERIRKEDISDEVISYPVDKLDYPNAPERKDYFFKF